MKHKTLRTLLCVILTVCFCLSAIVPASAAGLFGGDSGAATGWDQLIRGLKDRFIEKNPGTDETPAEPMEGTGTGGFEYKIVFLDCGRKYFSVDSIKKIIDNAAAAGFNYVQLAVGNDGMRFLLNDMSLTVNGVPYSTDDVSAAIHAGNEAYYNFDVDELTQSEMDTIIAYAKEKGVGIIPCVNTPGHMDAILHAATSLTGEDCSYSGSVRTIDVTNTTAVAFTKALVQKYIDYFAGKGCTLFNMGADEYANDKFTTGSMGFGNLQSAGEYSYYVTYVNQLAKMIKDAGMTPMAFNDGIYFNNNTSSGTFDTDIIICYWSNGWSGYTPMPATTLASKGFKMVNTHGDYYWVLGKYDWQCSPAKASGFNYKEFQGGTIDNPAGAMFCIWCDYPGAGTETSVLNSTKDTIAAFGKTLPTVTPAAPTISGIKDGDSLVIRSSVTLSVSGGAVATWTVDNENVLELKAVAENVAVAAEGPVQASSVTATAIARGSATVTATTADGKTASATIQVYEEGDPNTVYVTVAAGETTDPLRHAYGDKSGDAISYEVEGNVTAELKHIPATTGESSYSPKNSMNDGEKCYIRTSSGKYFNSTGATVDNIDAAQEWTWSNEKLTYKNSTGTTYYLRYRSGNYSVVSRNSQATSFYYNSGRFYRTYDWLFGTYSDEVGSSVTKTTTTGTEEHTNVIFTGIVAGTTTKVHIGDTLYVVTVTDKAPSTALTATSIDLEYWITNSPVHVSESENSAKKATIRSTDTGVQSEDGIAIASVAIAQGKSNFDGWKDVFYWQAMRLDAANHQTEDSGDDETADGTTLTHVRYHSGAWQYKTVDGTWHYFMTGDQLVAYYLQKTKVTKEIDTYVKDWGYGTGSTTPNTSSGNGQVALTVAIVYPDGSVSPTEANMYANSTTIFNYWDGRDIGIVAPLNNGDYNIAKITVTDGARKSNTTANQWYTSDTITWEKEKNEAGDEWYKETVVWDKVTNAGTTPMVNGKNSNITWSAKNTGKLVLIYLETIEKPDNLTVIYYDDNAGAEITRVPVVVGNGVTFKKDLKDGNGNVIGGTMNWPAETAGEGYLPDDAYVTNTTGVNQTFSKQISTLQNISSVYKSGIYKYVSANIDANDDKILILHFDLKNADASSFVVDFGLPITILPGDIGITNTTTIQKASLTANGIVLSNKGNYGTATIASNYSKLTYTLHRPLDKIATIPLFVTFEGGDQQEFQINIIPATNVYYEETFIENNGWSKVTGSTENQVLEKTGAKQNVYGYDPKVANQNANIGHSMGGVYHTTLSLTDLSDTSFMFSNPLTFTFEGTGLDLISACSANTGMLYVEVIGKEKGGAYRALVDTYFRGDDTNIIGNGETVYQVPVVRKLDLPYDMYTVTIKGYLYNGAGAVVKASTNAVAEVNSFSSYMVEEDALSTLVNALAIPGLTKEDIDVIYMDENSILNPNAAVAAADRSMAAYALDVASNAAATAEVYVDGFRVYNPLGESGKVVYNYTDENGIVTQKETYISLNDPTGEHAYNKDNEAGVVYYPVYDFIKDGAVELGGYSDKTGIYIEYDGATGLPYIATYKNQGPQNEIYLAPKSAIAFGINGYVTGNTIQVSARKVTNNAGAFTSYAAPVTANATEMYYIVKYDTSLVGEQYNYVVITNTTDGVLALSALKISNNIKPFMNENLKNQILKDLKPNEGAGFTPQKFIVTMPTTVPENTNFAVNVIASASDVSKVTLTIKANDSNETIYGVYNDYVLKASNSIAVKRKLAKNWSFDETIFFLPEEGQTLATSYTFIFTAYDKSDPAKTITYEQVVTIQ